MLITQAGLNKLKKTLDKKMQDRERALVAVSEARSLGDISENSELDAAKIELERCNTDITEINEKISKSVIFDSNLIEKEKVGFSAIVEIEDEENEVFTYNLLGPCESDLSKNILSITSPMGQSMLGKMVGDSFKVQRPIGEKEYTVLSIKYTEFSDKSKTSKDKSNDTKVNG